jgi:N-carbamoyl-L-amino-acid hydrolase
MTTHPAPILDATRLLRRLDEVSAFGRTAGGGVFRLAASREDGQARDWLRARFAEEGFRVLVDAVGNMYGILDLAGTGAPLVLTGSHLDSQPAGGRYDGAYGVVASLEAALAVRRHAMQGVLEPTRNLVVVNWTNEEGARFAPSTLGSAVYAGLVDEDFALARTDGDGVDLGAALGAIGYRGSDAPPRPATAYVELHIEQGPLLEREGRTIGIVEGNWGTTKYIADIAGEAAHTGPTPMSRRRDALLPAAELILFARALSDETGGALLSSVGRLDVQPNSTNVVAGQVRLYAEFRAVDPAQLKNARDRFEAKARDLSTSSVSVALSRTVDRPAGSFDPVLRDLIEAEAHAAGYSTLRLETVAGHDAIPIRAVAPSAMIFVPSAGGVSHNEAEFTRPDDLVAGGDVLARVLARLIMR